MSYNLEQMAIIVGWILEVKFTLLPCVVMFYNLPKMMFTIMFTSETLTVPLPSKSARRYPSQMCRKRASCRAF